MTNAECVGTKQYARFAQTFSAGVGAHMAAWYPPLMIVPVIPAMTKGVYTDYIAVKPLLLIRKGLEPLLCRLQGLRVRGFEG